MMLAANHTNVVNEILPILIVLAVIIVALVVHDIFTRTIEPWRRKYLNPRKQYHADWWRIRIWKQRQKNKDCFDAPSPFADQHLDVDHIVTEVAHDLETNMTERPKHP